MNNRIKELRKELGLSQRNLGITLGVTDGAISKIEKGERSITKQMFMSICREFNVNEEWLRTGKGEMFNKANKENEISKWVDNVLKNRPNNFKKRLLSLLTTLNEDEWTLLEKKAKELLSDESSNSQSSEDVPDEISVTEEKEEIQSKDNKMSIEEMIAQANYWENLIEKKQAEKPSALQNQNEDYGKMA